MVNELRCRRRMRPCTTAGLAAQVGALPLDTRRHQGLRQRRNLKLARKQAITAECDRRGFSALRAETSSVQGFMPPRWNRQPWIHSENENRRRSRAGLSCACSVPPLLQVPLEHGDFPRRGTSDICPKPHRVRELPHLPETTRNGLSLVKALPGLDAKGPDDRKTSGSSLRTPHLHVRQAGREPIPPPKRWFASCQPSGHGSANGAVPDLRCREQGGEKRMEGKARKHFRAQPLQALAWPQG